MKIPKLLKLFYALLAVFILGSTLAMAGVPIYTALFIALATSFVPVAGKNLAFAGLNKEIWTDVMVKEFEATEEASFLGEIPDESRHVTSSKNGENETIHLVDVGADPEVLINNNTYPIPYQPQVDADIPINLDKFQTHVTPVTEDEIKYIAYNKIKVVQKKHVKAIMKTKHRKALHAITPAANTAATPILVTTGPNDGSGRKRLLFQDLLRLKTALDNAGIEEEGRTLVLCSDHLNDLIKEGLDADNAAKSQMTNLSGGKLNQYLLGLKGYWYVNTPYINPATLVKKAFASVPAGGDQKCSTVFVNDDMFRASGSTRQYADDPTARMQQYEYAARHYYIVLPKKQRAIGAIVSDNV